MKERKIIVNKCDVSGCEFYCRYTDNCLDYKHWYDKPLCKNLPDCHYKQLKAKEQECETLASQLDFEVQKKECLEQECEELKEKYLELKEQNGSNIVQLNTINEQLDQLKEEKQGLIKDWEEKKNLAYEIACKNEKLKQTLTEIKEIVTLDKTSFKYAGSTISICDDILIKISEVTND